ncbi:hypothetical protein LTR20_010836 [Exophiala xenobiotica]|nr:hypothetical protein LTS13_000092 [Exophiala xenobiotica]KAK5391804.1 hypothetical protein LTR79_010903 [Exophiala xenobiotica]KAK5406463.1 hypothetical protein LTR90_010538 [Exophiala xenobiotica]KAK5453070.1 hypothetical protein LTR20_010836 [Exophiala xenobiotica]KAK5471750.1 hypothetical protein LTR26_010777 [Exophiala xenobiotica]
MALNTSYGYHLLSAILMASTVHRGALGSPQHETRLSSLYQTSITHLLRQKLGEDEDSDQIYIATALILCLTEILAGGKKLGSWKLHLQGAAALIESNRSRVSAVSKSMSPTMRFLWRWCRSLEVIACLSGRPFLKSSSLSPENHSWDENEEEYIDMFDGFSTRLYAVLQEINALTQEKRALEDLEQQLLNKCPGLETLRSIFDGRCRSILWRVISMSERPTERLDPAISSSCNPDQQSDFLSLNKMYHYATILEIYQRIMDKPPSDSEVQRIVKLGLETIKKMTQLEHASPGVATLHPVFTIGCSARDIVDRLFVIDWLDNMRRTFAMGNVHSAKAFLLELWQRNDTLDSRGEHLQWDKLIVEKDWDLSLY